MAQYYSTGDKINFAALRDYIFTHKIVQGDSIILHPSDFEYLVHEMRTKGEQGIEIPLKMLDVLLVGDTTDSVPAGKIQIVKNEIQ